MRAGKRLIVASVDVLDVSADRLAARATLTFAVLERRYERLREEETALMSACAKKRLR